MFKLAVVTVTLITILLPFIAPAVARRFQLKTFPAPAWLPIMAAVLFVTSFLLPDIHLSSQTDSFQQHFVGGGMYCAFLYLYFKKFFGLKLRWASDIVVLFAWVSTLGVANELLEFFVSNAHIIAIDTADTSWDLLANTLGAFFGYCIVTLFITGARLLRPR